MKKLLILLIVLITCVACFSSCQLIDSIIPCEHKETVADTAVAPTCTEEGLTEGSHCAKCGETIVAQEVVAAGHTYGEWETVSEGDCFTAGEKKRICTVCSEEDVEKSVALGHSFVQNEETKLFYCEICDARIFAGHLYAAFDVEMNWYDAYKYCDSLGGHLVTITSQEEQDLITEIVNSRTLPANRAAYFYWTGAIKNTAGWEWITGENFSYTYWGKNGLDGYTANWHIGIVTSLVGNQSGMKVGDWEDIYHVDGEGVICEWELDIVEDEHFFTEWVTTTEATCFGDGEKYRICTHCGLEETEILPQLEHNFIFNEATGVTACEHCSAAMYDGRIYKIFNVTLSWFDAYSYCDNLGGHLATITSAEEQTFVETYMRSQSYNSRTWLGGYNDGAGFKWITGEDFEYSNWYPGQPDCDGGTGYFVAMNYDNSYNGRWHDHTPLISRYFICEWEAK